MQSVTSRDRVNASLGHRAPDRLPVDFLAVPEIWGKLKSVFSIPETPLSDSLYFDPSWEALLRALEIDCRVVSYDQFCSPPESALKKGSSVEWWNVASRSTPCRMWRQRTPDGLFHDLFGRCFKLNQTGAFTYETNVPTLSQAESAIDLRSVSWPQPDWWDFSDLSAVVRSMNQDGPRHIRFRSGSVFEIAWQLRGMEQFLIDLATDPGVAEYLMDVITELLVESARTALKAAGDLIDMVYFYDDVATQRSLMISKEMWTRFIRPRHLQIIDMVKSFGKSVMYHSDGSIYEILPDLIDMGVDVINPVQADAAHMEPERLKREFGDRLCFHGGIDIIKTLPRGTVADVKQEVSERKSVLGENGGYILASCHHIQADTPMDNITAMYDLELR